MLATDLDVSADGVKEGRKTFANILKYVRMGTSSSIGNMLSMAQGSIVLPFLPLLPMQILLNDLLYGLSEVGIPFNSVDAEDVDNPHSRTHGSLWKSCPNWILVATSLGALAGIIVMVLGPVR